MAPGAHTSCSLSDSPSPMSKEALEAEAVERRIPPPSPRNRKCSWVGFLKGTKKTGRKGKPNGRHGCMCTERLGRLLQEWSVWCFPAGLWAAGDQDAVSVFTGNLPVSFDLLPHAYITHLGSQYVWKHCKALGHNEPPQKHITTVR